MTANERRILWDVVNSLSSIRLDLHVYDTTVPRERYDYDALGRIVMANRVLSELLGDPWDHMLPGEYHDDESVLADVSDFTPTPRSEEGQPLTTSEQMWLQQVVLPMLY